MLPLLVPLISNVLDKIFPDETKATEAKLKVMELAQNGELAKLEHETKLAVGQMEVNKEEAKGNAWQSGWRPAVGWVCATGLAYSFVIKPLLPALLFMSGVYIDPLPVLDNAELMTLLFGLLGLGAYRTVEKVKNAN